ncbi:MAG: 2-phosphosulfolactate phosphatase [Bacteroidetes bacterium]|nr:2-phosphosulfolactate phosphatase [Bacteroidota bacterium]
MKIDVSFSIAPFDELQLRDKNIVVIDILRASTTTTVALAHGAREIIPVANIESAVKISGSLFGEVTLRGGERNGKIIEGFNLGNSPLEYTETMVKGKSIIYCTTNGSVAMAKSRYARRMVVGSFVNISTVVNFMKQVNEDFLIICAGRLNGVGNFSLEDAVCAGMIVDKLEQEEGVTVELTDSSRAARALYKSFGRSILKMLKSTDHGMYLSEIGFENDLPVCAAVDSVPVLPQLFGTVVRLVKDEVKNTADDVSTSTA